MTWKKASQIGIPAYNAEQEEKRKLLDFLLSHYNDGRRKIYSVLQSIS